MIEEILMRTVSEIANDLYSYKEPLIIMAIGGAIAAAALNRFSDDPFFSWSPRGVSMAIIGCTVTFMSTGSLVGNVLVTMYKSGSSTSHALGLLTIVLGTVAISVNTVVLFIVFAPWTYQENKLMVDPVGFPPPSHNYRILSFREKFINAVKERVRTRAEKLSEENPLKPLAKGFLVKDRLENARNQMRKRLFTRA